MENIEPFKTIRRSFELFVLQLIVSIKKVRTYSHLVEACGRESWEGFRPLRPQSECRRRVREYCGRSSLFRQNWKQNKCPKHETVSIISTAKRLMRGNTFLIFEYANSSCVLKVGRFCRTINGPNWCMSVGLYWPGWVLLSTWKSTSNVGVADRTFVLSVFLR